jgi:hypothetical protein
MLLQKQTGTWCALLGYTKTAQPDPSGCAAVSDRAILPAMPDRVRSVRLNSELSLADQSEDPRRPAAGPSAPDRRESSVVTVTCAVIQSSRSPHEAMPMPCRCRMRAVCGALRCGPRLRAILLRRIIRARLLALGDGRRQRLELASKPMHAYMCIASRPSASAPVQI